jgi:ATP-binding cassette subfamily G (WHITE) protein 2
MLRERASGSYQTSSYFLARTIADLSIQLIAPIIFSIIVYPTIGFQDNPEKFFVYMFFMMFDTMAATSLATLVSCLCVSIDLTTVVMSILFEIGRLYGGYFIKPAQMDHYPEWKFADSLSYLKYVYVGVAVNEFEGLELTCTSGEIANGTCDYTNGDQVMEDRGYDEYTVGFCFGILIVYIICCRALAYVALRYIKG